MLSRWVKNGVVIFFSLPSPPFPSSSLPSLPSLPSRPLSSPQPHHPSRVIKVFSDFIHKPSLLLVAIPKGLGIPQTTLIPRCSNACDASRRLSCLDPEPHRRFRFCLTSGISPCGVLACLPAQESTRRSSTSPGQPWTTLNISSKLSTTQRPHRRT